MTLRVGAIHWVFWRNKYHPAEIVEKRELQDGNNTVSYYEYYVHYLDFDRRLDEWVASNQINPEEITTNDHVIQEKNSDHYVCKAKVFKRRCSQVTLDTETIRPGNGAEQPLETENGTLKAALRTSSFTDHKHDLKRKRASSQELRGGSGEDALELWHMEETKVRNIEHVIFSCYDISTWYFSPYPDDYRLAKRMYVCEFCFKYMKSEETFVRHQNQCNPKHPSGNRIYQHGLTNAYEIDGKINKVYCQNLCLFAKLFLDHKTVYYDTEPFLFYVLTETDKNTPKTEHVVGYFSKEKFSFDNYNLSCIIVFPPFQRKGYGKWLIEFSYELTKREGNHGSPERPLSDLGLLSYRSYWTTAILSALTATPSKCMNLRQLADETAIRIEDILSTLRSLDLLRFCPGQKTLYFYTDQLRDMVEKFRAARPGRRVQPGGFDMGWNPWIGRGGKK